MKYLLILSLLTSVAFAKTKARGVASSQTVEIQTYSGKPIVFASVATAEEDLEMPESGDVDRLAELVCKALGYKHERGNYTLNQLRDRGNRGPELTFRLLDDGSFKRVKATKMYSFKSVVCEAPLEPKCQEDHFDKTDVRFILFGREDCK
jgi:hypothetical protein